MPNDPYLDASVAWRLKSGTLDMHEAGYETAVESILSSGLATEMVGLISSGKEADVYAARYRDAPIVVKAYRLYRTSHKGGGPVKLDATGWLAAHEYEMTMQAWKGGVRVPAPAGRVENMFSMRYLGDEDGPAPKLKEVTLDDPGDFLGRVLSGVEGLARAGIVHSDLSPYNILVYLGEPWFIDLSEAIRVDRTGLVTWKRLHKATLALEVGLSAIQAYFRKYGLEFEPEPLVSKIIKSVDEFDVMGLR
jgi:RIO kinase 1